MFFKIAFELSVLPSSIKIISMIFKFIKLFNNLGLVYFLHYKLVLLMNIYSKLCEIYKKYLALT